MALETFRRVRANHPGRSVFNLSHSVTLSCDMGKLVPTFCEELVPGDIFKIANEAVLRMTPLVAPILHEINLYIHYFFVPYRLLWGAMTGIAEAGDWSTFISGGENGNDASVCPRWAPSVTTMGSLWDYLGFPIGIQPTDAHPTDFPRRAYNLIYNEYYRDETQIAKVALTNETIHNRAWQKDFFTSALPWVQRGTAPGVPISGTTNAVFTIPNPTEQAVYDYTKGTGTTGSIQAAGTGTNVTVKMQGGGQIDSGDHISVDMSDMNTALTSYNTISLSAATPFSISDLRLAFQIQRWMERNARAGVRYTEFLHSHFGVSPRDDRMMRPEYIGGVKMPIVISEVLQTSATGLTGGSTPAGGMSGHGLGVHKKFVGKYKAEEFGLIMGIMSVMPVPMYSQGIDRTWLRTSKYDWYFPEFAHLSEQAVIRAEIYATNVGADNTTVFGYQGRYNEMRARPNRVAGLLKYGQTFNYWTLAREFASAPALNQTFIECVPSKRVFADQSDHTCIVSVGNIVQAIRPLPIEADPGMVDHG